MRIGILGTGSVRPEFVLESAAMEHSLRLGEGSLVRTTGVERTSRVDEETSLNLALKAARRAIKDAGLTDADIDLIISAAAIPYQPMPSMASLIDQALGTDALAFDVNAGELGFLVAANTAELMIQSGRARKVLVVSSDTPSRFTSWREPDVGALFGDGAAAAVFGIVADTKGIVGSCLKSIYRRSEGVELASGGTRYNLHDHEEEFIEGLTLRVDRSVIEGKLERFVPGVVTAALKVADWQVQDVDAFVPHQSSRRGIEAAVEALGIPKDRVVNILADHGNQLAASIPSALDAARRKGLVKPGSKVLIAGAGSGVMVGALAFIA